MVRPEAIAVGVAGWSYPDWEGCVYSSRERDTLRFVSAWVDVIEINSSFYRPPTPRMAASWVDRTADRPQFFFTAKLHQDVTHRGELDPAKTRAFHEGLAPLVQAGRLRHLLAQFRWDFEDSAASRDRLLQIREHYADLTQLTLELRHASWQLPDALGFLRGLGVTVAALDYPLARNSFDLAATGVGDHAYLRLHGRNAKAWFSKDAGRDETYNYRYSKTEIEGIVQRAIRIGTQSASLTVIANNHYEGKEAAAALEIKSLLTGRPVTVPPLLRQKYPDLGAIARPDPGMLLP